MFANLEWGKLYEDFRRIVLLAIRRFEVRLLTLT
jgi:hypothetical protein